MSANPLLKTGEVAVRAGHTSCQHPGCGLVRLARCLLPSDSDAKPQQQSREKQISVSALVARLGAVPYHAPPVNSSAQFGGLKFSTASCTWLNGLGPCIWPTVAPMAAPREPLATA